MSAGVLSVSPFTKDSLMSSCDKYVGHTESNEQQFFYKLKFIVM